MNWNIRRETGTVAIDEQYSYYWRSYRVQNCIVRVTIPMKEYLLSGDQI